MGMASFRVSCKAETTAGCEVCLRAETMKNDNAINLFHDLKQKYVVEYEETYCDGLFKSYYPALVVPSLSALITIAKKV